MQKKPIIIISVLCVISLVLGYLSGLKEEESLSNGDAKTGSKKEPEFLKEGLVAYYPFNGNANDESGNGHDGIVAGPVLSTDRGNRKLSAYFFDGTDDLITADNVMLSANYAISMWFKSDEQSGHRTLLSTSDNYPDTYASIFFRGEGGNEWDGFFRFNNRNEASQSGGTDIYAKSINHYGKWHHAVCIKKSDKIQLYIDGKIIDEKLDAGGRDKKTSLKIGCNIDGWFYHGSIDDIRIYNRALSAEEVKALYEFEKAN